MRMRKFTGLFVLMFVLAMSLVINTDFAAATTTPTGIAAQGSSGEGCTSNPSMMQPMSTTYLKVGHCYINMLSSTQVQVSADTEAYSIVDTVAVDIFLQQWDPTAGVWNDVVHVGEFENYNDTTVAGEGTINVPSGFNYRTRALHWVSQDGILEQSTCYSSYIYVD